MEELEETLDNSVVDTPTSDVSPEPTDSTQEVPGLSDKFKFGEKVWSRDEFQKHYERLMGTRKNLESDYTKRVQDLKKQSEQHRFDLNYRHDLRKVRQNPALAAEFKKIYPREYHDDVDEIVRLLQRNQAPATESSSTEAKLPQEYLERLDKLEKYYESRQQRDNESDLKASTAFIDSTMTKLADKYPSIKEGLVENIVMNNASVLLDKMREEKPDYVLTESDFEAVCKSVDEKINAYADARYKTKVEKQTKASTKAKDSGVGGGIPTQAPKRMGLKDVRRDIESRIDAGQL